jgi:hypothetical protein
LVARTVSEDATVEYLDNMTKYIQNNLKNYTTKYAQIERWRGEGEREEEVHISFVCFFYLLFL